MEDADKAVELFPLAKEGVKANGGAEFPARKKEAVVRTKRDAFVVYVLGPGRMGLRLGLIKIIPPLRPPCTFLLLRWLTGVFALLRAPGGESVTIFSRFPLTSRFMMLAGVTGVRWEGF